MTWLESWADMTLLDFSRGPAMKVAMFVFVLGCVWRLLGIALLRGRRDLSTPRHANKWKGLRLMGLRSWPRKEFLGGTAFGEALGYTFHAGFFIALLFFLPHVLFFTDIFRGLGIPSLSAITGFSWPTLSSGTIFFFSAISAAALLAVLVHRIINPVKRMLSNFDDYFSWFVTFAPIVTGMAAVSHVLLPYQTLLALHYLSVALLLIWFPFGKLMHMYYIFTTRGVEGVQFERRGATL